MGDVCAKFPFPCHGGCGLGDPYLHCDAVAGKEERERVQALPSPPPLPTLLERRRRRVDWTCVVVL